MATDGPVGAEAIRKALGCLCTRGVEPWWIRDKAGVLLQLPSVRARARQNACADREEGEVDALIEILRELIEPIRDQSHGQILWIVLGLEQQYLKLNARERRGVAGRLFRKGEKPVSAETIRQLHEKTALDRLTALFVDFDRKFRESSRV